MDQEKEISVGVLSNDDGEHVISLSIDKEEVVMEIDEALQLFDVLGEALDVAGAFDDEDGESESEVRVCH